MEVIYRPYTYFLRNKINGKWYYGVKYAINANPNTFFIDYFTSSNDVKSDIELLGIHSFEWKIRKTFDINKHNSWENSVNAARNWEHTVLRRMKAKYRKDSYNKHDAIGFPVLSGDLSPSKRDDVRKKLSEIACNRSKETLNKIGASGSKTKLMKSIMKILKNRKTPVIKKSSYKIYKNYARFIEEHRPNLINIIKYFNNLATLCIEIPKKPYVRLKPNTPRSSETKQKISDSKRGKYHYTNIETGEHSTFYEHDVIPDGWVRKLHSDETKAKIRKSSTGRSHSKDIKDKISSRRASAMYFTNPELTEYREYSNIDDVPIGWVRGIKVKSRNDKISNNNRWTQK